MPVHALLSHRHFGLSKKCTYGLAFIALGLIFGLSLQGARAWTNPTLTPPSGNLAGPVNTGALSQEKIGSLASRTYVGSVNNGWGNLLLTTQLGSLPGYPGSNYPTLKTDGAGIYFSAGGAYSGWINSSALSVGMVYDHNNAGYYLDPAVTSRLNYGVFDNVYSYGWTQSPIHYDANDNNYYLDPNGTSRLATVTPNTICFGSDCRSAWPASPGSPVGDNLGNHTATQYLQMGPQWINFSSGGLYSTATGHHFWPGDSNYWYMRSSRGMVLQNPSGVTQGHLYHDGAGSFGLLDSTGNWRVRVGNGGQELYGNTYQHTTYLDGSLFDWNSPSYYVDPGAVSNFNSLYRANGYNVREVDVNNTAYYVDPSAASNFDTLCIRGICQTAWPASPGSPVGDNLGNHTATQYLQMGPQWINFSSGGLYSTATGQHFWPGDSNYWYMRSSNGMVLQNPSGTRQGYLYHTGTGHFGLLDSDGSWRVRVAVGQQELYGNTYLHRTYLDGTMSDWNNPAYYVAPGNISELNDLRVNILYDRQNTGYYVDPASTSVFNNLWSNVFIYNTSDVALKENIQTISGALESIEKLRGVTFNWKEDNSVSIGLIAQEVEKVYPELVGTAEKTGMKAIQYEGLIAPLVESVKELNRKIEGALSNDTKLENINADQQAKIDMQEKAIEELKKEVEVLKQTR